MKINLSRRTEDLISVHYGSKSTQPSDSTTQNLSVKVIVILVCICGTHEQQNTGSLHVELDFTPNIKTQLGPQPCPPHAKTSVPHPLFSSSNLPPTDPLSLSLSRCGPSNLPAKLRLRHDLPQHPRGLPPPPARRRPPDPLSAAQKGLRRMQTRHDRHAETVQRQSAHRRQQRD